ncbi:hypothetical protein C1646_777596 [Rhizophagus diaphanus]|nr:hypothetical protein C1646_777596 [Rhizophagus diaphanus] [Rhizophagus sp. MUCL 43196]
MDNNRNIGYPNYPMMNGGVFSASYANTPAYTDTPGNFTTSESSQILPPHPPQYMVFKRSNKVFVKPKSHFYEIDTVKTSN